MATAMELAMREAAERKLQAEREAAPRADIRETVAVWSSDDTVHTDPPLQQPPAAPAPQEQGYTEENPLWVGPPAPEPPAPEPVVLEEEMTATQRKENDVTNVEVKQQRPNLKVPQPKFVGVSEACQTAVRDNPGALRRDLIRALIDAGYKESSLSSLFGQMHTQGIIKADDEGHLWARYKRYHPLVSYEIRRRHGVGMSRTEAGRIGGLAPHKNRPPKTGTGIDKAHKQPKTMRFANGQRVATHQDSARYANHVRWARAQGKPVPTWEAWARENIGMGLAKAGLLKPDPTVAKDNKPAKAKVVKTPVAKAMKQAQAILRGETTPVAAKPVTLPAVLGVQGILDSLTISQARQLFNALSEIFGK